MGTCNETIWARFHPDNVEPLSVQAIWLFVLALPVACISWTVTHEELFREPREFCVERSQTCRRLLQRKFFFLFTCDYCFSHYTSIAVVCATGYHLLLPGWKGYVIAIFSVVWIANIYMAIVGRLRLEVKSERLHLAAEEQRLSPARND
jgi:hypothetical protein